MSTLDAMIRSLRLNSIDSEDGPTVFPTWSSSSEQLPSVSVEGCSCASFTLASRWRESTTHCPCWTSTPSWGPSHISPADIQKESARRLCWSVILLAAGNLSYTTSSRTTRWLPNYYVGDPSNFSLLLSGESLLRSSIPGNYGQTTVWGLYDRILLLWLGCLRMRYQPPSPDDEAKSHAQTAEFAVNAWVECDYLERELNRHTCVIERSFIFQGREYLFK